MKKRKHSRLTDVEHTNQPAVVVLVTCCTLHIPWQKSCFGVLYSFSCLVEAVEFSEHLLHKLRSLLNGLFLFRLY